MLKAEMEEREERRKLSCDSKSREESALFGLWP